MISNPPCWAHTAGVIGIFVAIFPTLMKATAAGRGVPLRHFATQGAAYMAVYSALLWAISAEASMSTSETANATAIYANAMAAIYAASAAFFTSASFQLEGEAGKTVPIADAFRIPFLYSVAVALPLLLSVALISKSLGFE